MGSVRPETSSQSRGMKLLKKEAVLGGTGHVNQECHQFVSQTMRMTNKRTEERTSARRQVFLRFAACAERRATHVRVVRRKSAFEVAPHTVSG